MDEWLAIKGNLFLCYFVSLWSGRVDKLTSWQVTCNKEEICSHVTLSTSQATRSLVYLSTCQPCYSVSLTSNLSTRLTYQLVNFRKDNSQTENQKGVNNVPINALLACKRCSLRPLLTPFWSAIKNVLLCCFITNWFPFSYKPTFYMCFLPWFIDVLSELM